MKPRVRIFPNRNCVGLVAVLIAMTYAGASQTNGAAYLLAFTLASLAAVSFSHAWVNIRGLSVQIEPVRPVFAGEKLHVRVGLAADGSRTRYGLRIGYSGRIDQLPAGGRSWLDVEFPAPRRGRFETLAIEVRSLYPLGFFTAGARVELPAVHFVYPEPNGGATLPPIAPVPRAAEASQRFEGEDFAGVRPYRTGDSQRHIDWKAVARGQPMLIKQWAGDACAVRILDFQATTAGDPEGRLRQLARWVVLADGEEIPYGLRLPSLAIQPASGEQHRHACLRALAAYVP